jgi:hypothetical protein
VAVDLQCDVVGGAQQGPRGRIGEHEVGVERRQRRDRRRRSTRRGRCLGLHQPARRDPWGDQRIQAQQVRRMRLPVGAAQPDRKIDRGAGLRHARGDCDARVQILGQQSVARAYAEVGRAARGVHRGLELRQRRRVDQLHRERERHAQRDGQHGRGLPPRMVAPLGPQQSGEQRRHRQRERAVR